MILWPLLVYALLVMVLVALIVGLSHVLGERHHAHASGRPYESGIVSTGGARIRYSAQFYLVAMFFVIFDLEAVFLFAWAVSARQTGWSGYAEAVVFTFVLVAALIYLWRVGALDWGPRPEEPRDAGRTGP